ncbi:MAG: hypothetical protein Q9191_001639, partial [Dirinaria sp. TL-2023a]
MVKPLERFVHRLVNYWQLSQPPHLRHLAIIRDTAVIQRTSYYVHYSYENFKKLVDSGLRSWDAVAATDTSPQKGKLSIPPPDAQPEVDEYGFHKIAQDQFQGNDHDATLSDCINAWASKARRSGGKSYKHARIANEEKSRAQIDPVQDPHVQKSSRAHSEATPDLPIKRSYAPRAKRPPSAPNKRLIEKVDIPTRFWTMSLKDREKSRQSQFSGIKYAVGKAEKEIALLTEKGGDPVAIREAVYADIDASHIASGLKPPSEAMRAFLAGQYEQWRMQSEDEAKRIYQARKDAQKTFNIPQQYLPSVAAHTQQYLGDDAMRENQSVRPKAIARGRARKSDTVPQSPNSPDAATHTAVVADSPQNPQPDRVLPTKRKFDRPSGDYAVSTIPYFPSIAAHTRPFIDPAHFIRRRERNTKIPRRLADCVILDGNQTTSPTVTTPKRKRDLSPKAQSTKRWANRDIRLSFYGNLAETVHRPSGPGVWLSNVERDSSRRGKPRSMLAIFKSERLNVFSWFVRDEPVDKLNEAYTPEQLRLQAINVFERSQPRKKTLESNEHHLSPYAEQTSAMPSESRALDPDFSNAENIPKRACTGPGVLAQAIALPDLNNPTEYQASLAEAGAVTIEQEQEAANRTSRSSSTNIQGSKPNHDQEIQSGLATLPDAEISITPRPLLIASDGEVTNSGVNSNHGTPKNNFEYGGNPPPQSPTSEATLREAGTDSVKGGALNVPNVEPSKYSAPYNLSKHIRDKPSTKSNSQKGPYKIQKLGAPGGSMAILRKKIILELLEQCGGAIPGERALEIAFTNEWKKHGQDGNPDKATIKAATKALIQTGEIYRLSFSFQNANGRAIVKPIFILSRMSNDNPKIKQIQEGIMSNDPITYIPEELGLQDEHSKTFIENYHTQQVRTYHRSVVEEDTVIPHIKNKPLYLLRFEARKKAREERAQNIPDRDDEELEDADRRQRRRGNRDEKSERQLIKGRLGHMRRKYPDHQPLTASEQQKLLDEYRASYEKLVSLTPNVYLTNLPAFPPLVENQTFQEFSEACLPPLTRMKIKGAAARPIWRILHLSDMVHPQRKVERLASLKSPLPKPNIKNVKLHSRIGDLGTSKWRRTIGSQAVEAEEDGSQLPGTDYRKQSEALMATQPPWEVLQLQTINPWNLSQMRVGNDVTTPNELDIVRHEFIDDIDELMMWELQYVEHDYTFEGSPFVNHMFLQGHQLAEHPVVDMDEALRESWTGRDERYTLRRLFPRKKHSMDSVDAWNITGTGSPFQPPTTSPSRSPSPLSPSESDSESDGPLRASPPHGSFGVLMLAGSATSEVPVWLRPKRSSCPARRKHAEIGIAQEGAKRKRAEMGTEQEGLDNAQRQRKKVKLPRKRKKKRRRLSQDDEDRLMVAVIVIRTLTGGLDRHIDWNIVAKVFEPEFDEMVVHKAWQMIRQNYKIIYEKTLFDFQEVFPSAYERGEVPAIDYGRLEDYPWARVVDWALENLDIHTRKSFELPMDRAGIDNIFSLKPMSEASMTTYFSAEYNMNVSKRLNLISKQAFTCAITGPPSVPSAEKQESEGLAIAKSWIRANVVVPAATYDPQAAASKLGIFREDVLGRSIKELTASRVLSGQKENRIIPGRNYDLSDHCTSVLEKTLSTETLHGAAAFKDWLDEQFRSSNGAAVTVQTISKDHEALALINLFSHGRIQLKPKDPPMDEWGLLDRGYETRQMDKARLKFAIEVSPTAKYIYGNPLLSTPPLPPPPGAQRGDQKQPSRIPFWYDLFNNLVPVLWDLSLVGVLGVLMQRPGADVKDIESHLRPALGEWEIELLLQWL